MPLTEARLDNLRARANNVLIDTCKIEYNTISNDGMGGQADSWTARGTAIPCYLESDRVPVGDVVSSGSREDVYMEHTLYIANDGTIVPGDKITLDSRVYYAEGVIEIDTARCLLAAKVTLED